MKISPPYQTSYIIYTNSNNLIDILYLKLGKYVHAYNGRISEHSQTNVIEVYESDGKYKVIFKDKVIVTESPIDEVDTMLFQYTEYDDDIFAMHGSALEYQGNAYLFLAPTTSGKTTLASFLLSNNFGYITDDCILLDRKDFVVYPYNAPIHLREGGVKVLHRYGCEPEKYQMLGNPPNTRYIYDVENPINNPTPLSKIYFIVRTGNENRLCEMTSAEKMTELMKSPITNYPLTSEYLRFISALAKKDCYRLLYADMAFVRDMIINEKK